MVSQYAQAAAGANASGDIPLTVRGYGHVTGRDGCHADHGDSPLSGFFFQPVRYPIRAYGGDFHAGQTQEVPHDLHGKPFLAEQYYLHAAAPI